jgi:hypothetical protein
MPLDSYTKLLIHFDGADGDKADITATTGQAVTTVGDAQIDTAYKKFGTGSLLLDGTGDYCTVPDSADWYFADQPFTIDGWVRSSTAYERKFACGQYIDSSNFWQFYIEETGINTARMHFLVKSGGDTKSSYYCDLSGWTANTFRHIELSRNGASIYFFVDGFSQTLTTTTAISTNEIPNLAAVLLVGSYGSYPFPMNGWLDEFRVSKGIARHTANFTPPVSPYPIEDGLLIMFD